MSRALSRQRHRELTQAQGHEPTLEISREMSRTELRAQGAPGHPLSNELGRSGIAGLAGMMDSAVQVSMSRSTVVYDGARTYVEAEEQELRDGRWEQRRVEGVWEGDKSREAIERLSRAPRSTLTRRPRVKEITPPRLKR